MLDRNQLFRYCFRVVLKSSKKDNSMGRIFFSWKVVNFKKVTKYSKKSGSPVFQIKIRYQRVAKSDFTFIDIRNGIL